MNISISSETQKLLEDQIVKGRFATPDEAVKTSLQALDELRGSPIEDLDEETQTALDRAFAQSERGEGKPCA